MPHAHAHTHLPTCTMHTLTYVFSHGVRTYAWTHTAAYKHAHVHTRTSAGTPHARTPTSHPTASVAGARDSVLAADMESVEGPGLRDVDDAGVLLPEYRVVPEPGDPEGHKEEGEGEGVEEEEAVTVHEEALALLVQDEGQHGEEGEDEEDEDLALCDQVPEKASE